MPDLFPPGHPIHTLGYDEETGTIVELHVEVTGGGRPDCDGDSLREWATNVTFRSTDEGGEVLASQSVATMNLTVVNEYLGDPLLDLDARDADSLALAEALWVVGGERTDEFEEACLFGAGGPVLLVDTYKVKDGWRGTPLTALLACRILDVFSRLGIGMAALYASPMNGEIEEPERSRVQARIADMWAQCGFQPISPSSPVMVTVLDPTNLTETMNKIAAGRPTLIAALEDD